MDSYASTSFRARGATSTAGALVAAAGVVIMLSGCGASAPSRDDGLAVATYKPTYSGGMDALLTGTVENLDGCLTIRGTDPYADEDPDQAPYVPVFATNDPTATRLVVGESVDLGGGVSDPGSNWTVPSACPPDGPFWLVPSG